MDSNKLEEVIYEFGDFQLILKEHLLLQNDEPISLPPKVFKVLVILVENSGHLITKDELLDKVWADAFVEEATLARTISRLRKALHQNSKNKYIETISKKGYRFIAPVNIIEEQLEANDDVSEDSEANKIQNAAKKEDGKKPIEETPENLDDSWRVTPKLLVALGFFAVLIFALAFIWQTEVKNDNLNVKSIAVLPFKMIGETEEDKALKLGMADALIVKFSNLNQIVVRPTSAISKYSDQEVDAIEIGKTLKVDAVLDGNIQKFDNQLRITVQLLSSKDGTPLWADKFDSRSSNIFTLQDDISKQVTDSLEIELTGVEKEQIAKRQTENADAYKAYMKGRLLWNRRNPSDLTRALEFFEQAVKFDSNYALAYAGISDCYQLLVEYRVTPSKESFQKAREAAKKALEIDPNLAEAHASLGYILAFYDWKFDEGEKQFKKAIELNPNYPTARQWYAELLMAKGRFDEAKIEVEKSQELDPVSPIIATNVVAYYYITRQYEKSIKSANEALEFAPNFGMIYAFQSVSYYKNGMEKEAIATWLKATELLGGKGEEEFKSLRQSWQDSGWKGFWGEWLKQMKANPQFYLPWDFAICNIYVGNKEKALEWLEKSYENRDRWIVNINHNPQFDPIRSEPKFQEIVKKVGL